MPWSVLQSMEEEEAVVDSWKDAQKVNQRQEATEESAPCCAEGQVASEAGACDQVWKAR